MTAWNYIVSAACLTLLCFMVWKEVRRPNRRRLILRIAASFIAVVNLACLALPIVFYTTTYVDDSKEAILLTEGYNTDSVRAFVAMHKNNYSIYVADKYLKRSAQALSSELITDVQMINQQSEKLRAIHLFGYGLNQEELQRLNAPVLYHSSNTPKGITNIYWQHRINSGDELSVQGSFNNNSTKKLKLVLEGLQTSLDSVVIPAKRNSPFTLATIPKHLDKAVYTLLAFDGVDTIEREDIPVEVMQAEPIKILMLSGSPDFENKFLKNRLGKKGYSVAIRSRISKDKFYQEYMNISNVSLVHLTASLLDKFDVVIADAAELAAIPRVDIQAIRFAVQNKGLGLLVRADSSVKPGSFYASGISLLNGKVNTEKTVSLFIKSTGRKPVKIMGEPPVSLHPMTGAQSLITDDKSDVLARSNLYGDGKIIVITLENTYALLLAGNASDYDDIWKLLLEKACKKTPDEGTVVVSPALPELHKPMTISLQGSGNLLQVGQVSDDEVYLQQDPLLPFINTGTYWPYYAGWLPQVDQHAKINWLYVYKNNDWKTIHAVQKMKATMRYASMNKPRNIENRTAKKEEPFSIPKVYFFFIFIASTGFLWFEKKLN